MLVKCNFPVLPLKKKHINIFSNQWQLQAFQLAAHLGDKTKVFINDGDPLLKPHSNCLFNTISGWVCPLFPEAYLPQVCVQNRNFCTGNSLLSRLSNGESEWKYPDLQSAQKIMWYSQKGTFIYPEPPNTLKNCSNYENYVVNYLFYGDLEGLGYICVSAWKKIYPWRHSNCWLPNSFVLGGGEAFKVLKCW